MDEINNGDPAQPARPPAIQTMVIRAGGKDGPQIVESGDARWNDAAEQRFLDSLGACCNVTRAAKGAGFSREAIYRRRRTDPGFAARWREALVQGYVRIEMLLIENAEAVLAGVAPDPQSPIPPMSVKEAMNLLAQHRGAVEGDGNRRRNWAARPRDMAEVRANILVKLEAIAALPSEEGADEA